MGLTEGEKPQRSQTKILSKAMGSNESFSACRSSFKMMRNESSDRVRMVVDIFVRQSGHDVSLVAKI